MDRKAPPDRPHPLLRVGLERWRRSHGDTADPATTALVEHLERHGIEVAYQPIVVLGTERTVGAEALLRVPTDRHPELDSIIRIVEVAERSGLIDAIGLAVLDRAADQLAAWQAMPGGADWQIHVNVSPVQLRDPTFPDRVEQILANRHVRAASLVLEVTETAALGDDGVAQRTLQMLEGRGVELAIDDFGTGYASLDLLARIPARTLKIDRTFVDAIGTGGVVRGRGVVVEAAVGLGRSVGLRVVAEGVETTAQADVLRSWGCQYAQGYHFGRPGPADDLLPSPADTVATRAPGGASRLPAAAQELAAASATLLLAGTPDRETLYGPPVELARALAAATTMERDRADTNLVLSILATTPADLPALDGLDLAALEQALSATPDPGAQAPVGALATFVRDLATARAAGWTCERALTAVGHDVDVPAAVRGIVRAWWPSGIVARSGDLLADRDPGFADVGQLVGDATRRLRVGDAGMHRVRSLLGLALVIGSRGELVEVLDACASEARSVLGAATVSISRFETDRARIHTLVNVGDLASWEERHPVAEYYDLDDYAQAAQRILDRSVNIGNVDDPEADPAEVELLRTLGKGSWAGTPILVDGEVWGELYAVTHRHEPGFTVADGPFLLAIASLVGVAIARTQDLLNLQQLAHEDPLTGLPNRRRMEDHGTRLLQESRGRAGPGVAMIDVNGLKDHNDEFGHSAGDELLRTVARVLAEVAAGIDDALVARVGGDEFCLLVPGDEPELRAAIGAVHAGLSRQPPPQPRLAIGAAVGTDDDHDLALLLARADAAQYDAKRSGAPLVVHGARRIDRLREDGPVDRGTRQQPRLDITTALQRWHDTLESDRIAGERLETLGDLLTALLDLNRWVVSTVQPDGALTIIQAHIRRLGNSLAQDGVAVPLVEQEFHLDDYPLTHRAFELGLPFAVDVDDPLADPDERTMLEQFGHRYVIGLPTEFDGRRTLLELMGDERSVPCNLAVHLASAVTSYRTGSVLRHLDDGPPTMQATG
jgi:diguanylate cyclase (GGDEF)-like protein